jgi:hypothetical protein
VPYDWEYGQWERVRLYPVQVDILILKCDSCGEVYRVYPSFVIEGTTLTLPALIFVAFAYEYSYLTWRDLPEKFCEEHNRIAHSTLYKAVHGLGKSIADSDNGIKDAIKQLADKYIPVAKEPAQVSVWPAEKSLHEHTLKREAAVRALLVPLVSCCITNYDFTRLFYAFIRTVRTILSDADPPVYRLYIK